MIIFKIYKPDTTLKYRTDILRLIGSVGVIAITTQDKCHMKLLDDKIKEALEDEIFASVKAPHANKLVSKQPTLNNE